MSGERVDVLLETITCRLCGNSALVPWRQAHVHHDYRCKPCDAKRARERTAARKATGIHSPRNPDQAAEYEMKRASDPSVKARKAREATRYSKSPELRVRHEARWAARREIAAGRLVRQACESCGKAPTHAHHDDYNKPLAVRWLCPGCHRAWHKNNTPIYPESRIQPDGRG